MGKCEFSEKETHLFYVNNTLIFYKSEESVLLNLKFVLLCYQAVSGLNIYLFNPYW